MTINMIPWSLRGINPFLNSYGDGFLFRKIRETRPIQTNPASATGLHSAVPHRYVHAYLLAAKSFLQHDRDFAVYVHDDGSLQAADKQLIEQHLPGVNIVERRASDEKFDATVNDPFLTKVRKSYTSYIKLFDPTLVSTHERIIILDTDTLFLQRPDAVINWAKNGGKPWYHLAPLGNMKAHVLKQQKEKKRADTHIQTLIMKNIDDINKTLGTSYMIKQGFCSGFIGYDNGTIEFSKLKKLLEILYGILGERIFRWGAEQTTHGLTLCEAKAEPLPIEDYFVFTQKNASLAKDGVFVHFVGENRYHKMIYPRLARTIINELI